MIVQKYYLMKHIFIQDTGDFGKVTYKIVGEGSDVFTIHPEEGHIQVNLKFKDKIKIQF